MLDNVLSSLSIIKNKFWLDGDKTIKKVITINKPFGLLVVIVFCFCP
jgi:hypothetical protein